MQEDVHFQAQTYKAPHGRMNDLFLPNQLKYVEIGILLIVEMEIYMDYTHRLCDSLLLIESDGWPRRW
jgi:hypothetical protein